MPNCSWPPISQLLLLKLHFSLSFSTSFPPFFFIFSNGILMSFSRHIFFSKTTSTPTLFLLSFLPSIHKLLHLFLIPSVYSRWDGKVVRNWHHGTWHLPRRSEIRHDTSRSSSAYFGRLPLLISTTYYGTISFTWWHIWWLKFDQMPVGSPLFFSAPETKKNVERRQNARVRI